MAKTDKKKADGPPVEELSTSSAFQWFQKVSRGEATIEQVPGKKRRDYVKAALDHPDPMRLFPFSRRMVQPQTQRIVGPYPVQG